MYSHLQKLERNNRAERDQRKTGSYEYQNATDAHYQLGVNNAAFRTAPHGLPLVIQDAQGNLINLVGLEIPVTP